MNNNIVIIGAGRFGRAIEKILQNKSEIAIELWDINPSIVSNQKLLTEIVPSVDFLFLCIPTIAIRKILSLISPYLNKKTLIISPSKGIEENTLKTAVGVLEELLSEKNPYALLFGPMIAEEIIKGMPGIGVVATKKQEVFAKMETLFADTNLQIEYSSDLQGVALAGILKNIYAIGLGMSDALEIGKNFKGWLVQKAIKEMAEIIELLGGKKETAFDVAGLGDFIATAFAPYSSNREVGEKLIKTGKILTKSEGLVSLPSLLKLLGKDRMAKFPLLQALKKIIIQNENAKIIFKELLKEKKR